MTTNTDTTKLLNEVESTIRMMAKRAARRANGSIEMDDLIQTGRLVALNCAKTYNPTAGASFRTYCWNLLAEHMRREVRRSRSVVGLVTKNVHFDDSFSAPISTEDDSVTLGMTIADDKESVEDSIVRAELDAKVRAIVAKVRAEQEDGSLFDDLLTRLMSSHFAAEGLRLRSEVSYAELAEKHGGTRQRIHQCEGRVRAALVAALAQVAA